MSDYLRSICIMAVIGLTIMLLSLIAISSIFGSRGSNICNNSDVRIMYDLDLNVSPETMSFVSPLSLIISDDFSSMNDDLWQVSHNTNGHEGTKFLPSNVWVSNGKLILRSYVDQRTGGEFWTKDTYYYGKYRARMKLDITAGTYMTFFTFLGPMPDHHNEIDMEMIIQDGKTVAIIGTWLHGVKTEYIYPLPFDPAASYHTYGFDWYSDHVDFYVDDMTTPVWASYSNIPNEPSYVMFNTWIEPNPPANHGTGINMQYVDWVTVETL